MAAAAAVSPRPTPLGELRERYRAAEEAESADRARYVEALKAFLATAERHADVLTDSGSEVAPLLDEAAMAFYRASMSDLARRAVDLGLKLVPGNSSLLHHKALVLLALNEDLPGVVALVDRAIEANPHDKGLWATKGDALRLQGHANEAAEAYLHAQELDAASTQYVDRALRLAPQHPRALRLKVELARAHGGDLQGLAACDELLKTSPDDVDLLRARAELLAALGRLEEALEPIAKVRAARPEDVSVSLLHAKILFRLDRAAEAVPIARAIVDATTAPDGATLEQVASVAVAAEPELALAARERLRVVEPRNVQNLLDLRTLATRLGRFDAALAAGRAVLEASPDNLEAMRGIAELESTAGHVDQALEAYRAIARAHPHAVGELRKALDSAREAGKAEAVREFAEAILLVDPVDPHARVALARTLANAGNVGEAVRAYDALLGDHPGEIDYLLEKKELLAESNDPERLAPVLDELFRIDPTRTDVAVERGNLQLGRAYDLPEGSAEREAAARAALVSFERASGDPDAVNVSLLGIARASRLVDDRDRALRSYLEFLVRPGNSARLDIHKEYAHALREAGRFGEASEEYRGALAGGLEDPDLYWGAAEVDAHLNQDASALRLLDLLLARDPANPMFLRRKGQLLLRGGRGEEALRVLQQAVEAAHGDPQAYFEVAEALRSQGAYPDAIEYCKRGLEIDPKHRHGRVALAETLLLAGRYPEVVAIVDPLLKEDPNDLAAWKARADAWRALGRTSEVLYSYQAILLLEPDDPGALLETYRLRRDAGERKEAFDALTRVLQSSAPEAQEPTLHLERGDLAAALGLPDEANASYERAAAIDPAFRIEISVRRARLRLTAGRPDLALELLDEALNAAGKDAPPNVAALLLRAEILSALERPSEARAAYEEVRKRDPRSPVALAGIGQAMLAEGHQAEAVELLRNAIPQLPPERGLFLVLAEAESGLGELERAAAVLKKGVEKLPKETALWVRLGEVAIARQAWPDAASAFAHAIAIDPSSTDLLLRAGFVAERLNHPNEALAFYERATEAEATNKQAWTSRGVALLALARPADAQASFDRALALDSDFAPAKDGRKLAIQRTRDAEVQRFGREALLLEAKLHRAVAKNDLFVSLHVPFEFLDPVLAAIGRPPKVDLDRLEPAEVHDLESASYHLVTAALEHRPPGIERRGFTLADVAVLAPPTYSLLQIQRLFGYLKAVLEADLRPENLSLAPDVEELARKALALPPEQRTLFQIVRTLRVGIYKARLIKVVESAGAAVHAPLPSLDLGAYSPEFLPAEGTTEGPEAGEEYFAPETGPPKPAPGEITSLPEPVAPAPAHVRGSGRSIASTPAARAPGAPRCVGCGGIASVGHSCGAALCRHCTAGFPKCPKCGRPFATDSFHPLAAAATDTRPRALPRPSAPSGASKAPPSRPKPAGRPAPEAPDEEPAPVTAAKTVRLPAEKGRGAPPTNLPSASRKETPAAPPARPTATSDDEAPEEPPAPKPRREKTDDEPRL
jgi:tetratricopeptide (TPR) repeat protein